MDQVELVAEPRSVTGKRVKQLRAQGIIPLVVYGRKTKATNLQAVEFDTRRALAESSGQLIALRIDGETEARMTLARDSQRDVLTGSLLHVDLYEVDMTETVQVDVSLVLTGEPALVTVGEMVLSQLLNAVEIECLPGDILQLIEVDVSGLAGLSDAIHVSDLVVPDNITVLTDGNEMVARLNAIVEEVEE